MDFFTLIYSYKEVACITEQLNVSLPSFSLSPSRSLCLCFSKAEAFPYIFFSLSLSFSCAVNVTILSFNWIAWLCEKINKIIREARASWCNSSEGNLARWLLNHFRPGAVVLCPPVATMKVICPILIT